MFNFGLFLFKRLMLSIMAIISVWILGLKLTCYRNLLAAILRSFKPAIHNISNKYYMKSTTMTQYFLPKIINKISTRSSPASPPSQPNPKTLKLAQPPTQTNNSSKDSQEYIVSNYTNIFIQDFAQ